MWGAKRTVGWHWEGACGLRKGSEWGWSVLLSLRLHLLVCTLLLLLLLLLLRAAIRDAC